MYSFKTLARITTATFVWVLAAVLAPVASAQESTEFAMVLAAPISAMTAPRCGPPELRDPAWDRVWGASAMGAEEARAELVALQLSLRTRVESDPSDVDRQYLLAAVMGVRAEIETGKTKLRVVHGLFEQASTVLRLDPHHPGAQHILGRLHLAVMTTGRIQRFVATNVLGASALRGASWDEAERLLAEAVRGDPCVPDHHYELGRLYAERDLVDLAVARLRHVLQLTADNPRGRFVQSKARSLLKTLENR